MQRVLSLWFPAWSVDLIRRRQRRLRDAQNLRRPVLLVTQTAGRELVTVCSSNAQQAGVQVGMTLAEARALLSPQQALVDIHRPLRELHALEALAAWTMRFSPVVAVDEPDGILLDIRGCERLFGSERVLMQQIVQAFSELGFRVRLASADTIGAAWAAARFARSHLSQIARGHESAELASLPVECLRLGEPALDKLRSLGIGGVDALLKLPRSKLPARFGEELLLRLDQALARQPETLVSLEWRAPLFVETVFEGLVADLETIRRASEGLIAELATAQREGGNGILELEYRAFPSDSPPTTHGVQISRPSADVSLLFGLLNTKLESLQMGFGIERVTLEATRVAKLEERQTACWSSDKGRALAGRATELIDTLASRLSPAQMLECQVREAHLPEACCAYVPFLELGKSRALQDTQGVTAGERPSELLERPVAIELGRAAAGAVSDLRLGREVLRIAHVQGPERITGPWWQQVASVRDYYRVRTSLGRLLWIFQEPSSRRWFLHGEWC